MDEDDIKNIESLTNIMLDISIKQSKKIAKTYKTFFDALIKEGFDEKQALSIVLKNQNNSFIKN